MPPFTTRDLPSVSIDQSAKIKEIPGGKRRGQIKFKPAKGGRKR